MPGEACRLAFRDVLFHAIAAEADSLEAELIFQLLHQLQAALVRQPDVADDEVKLMARGELEGFLGRRGAFHLMLNFVQ